MHRVVQRRRVVVTGLGICCPLGTGAPHVWKRLIDGECGITTLPQTLEFEQIPSKVAGLVPRGTRSGEFRESEWVNEPELKKSASLSSLFAVCAASEALKHAGWKPTSEEECLRTGVSIGSSTPSMMEIYDMGKLLAERKYNKITPYFVPRNIVNMPAGLVSIRFGLRGPCNTVSTACATGIHSIGDGAAMIAQGLSDVMVVGATETTVEPIAMAGFGRVMALSTRYNDRPREASRPFDSGRDGFVMSEGAGVLVLESLDHAKSRDAEIHAEILGYGMSGDAYHITKPSGTGAVKSMQSALNDAGISPDEVGHISAHATSTPIGDSSENGAIKEVFKDHAYNLLISAPKSCIGHMMSASGAAQAIFAVLAVQHGVAPPTINLTSIEPEFDLNYVPNSAVEWKSDGKCRIALINSYGFGGTNGSLCIGEYRE